LIDTLEGQLLAALPSGEVQQKLGVDTHNHDQKDKDTVLGRLDAAFLDGRFTTREYIDNLKSGYADSPRELTAVLFIAGHENVQQALLSLLMVLSHDQVLQNKIRKGAGPWATAWQPDPAVFRPERWGSSVEEIDALARRTRSSGEFATFHGGLRACECV
jgi:hypothetical protein